MSKLSALLIFNILSFSAFAQGPDFKASGFVYHTHFSDTDWYDNETRAAINLDTTYDNFAIRAQVATYDENALRRLTFEYSFPVNSRNFTIQAGRFPRIDSFFNNITDNPGTANLAILPMAGYNRRMNTGTFTMMDGVQIFHSKLFSENLIFSKFSYGRLVVEDQKDTQIETFKTYNSNIKLSSRNDNFDAMLGWKNDDWSIYSSYAHYSAKTDRTNDTMVARLLEHKVRRVEYSTLKFGIKYEVEKCFIQAETMTGRSSIYEANNKTYFSQVAKDFYLLLGYNMNESTSIYTSYSQGDSNRGSHAKNTVIGLTKSFDDLKLSIEYHKGQGRAWKKFDTKTDDWNSVVISTTYTF